MRVLCVLLGLLLCENNLFSQKITNGSFENDKGWLIDHDEKTNIPGFIITNGIAKKIPSVLPGTKHHGISQRISGHKTNGKIYQLNFSLKHITGKIPKAKVIIRGGSFGDKISGKALFNNEEANIGEDIIFANTQVHSLNKDGEYSIQYTASTEDIVFKFASNNKDTSYEIDNVSIIAIQASPEQNIIIKKKVNTNNQNELHAVLRDIYE